MGQLFHQIRDCIAFDRYVVGLHASERLDERGILEWQVVAGIATGRLSNERPQSRPNPVVEVAQMLSDGSECTVVWAYLRASDLAKLVTVYFPD